MGRWGFVLLAYGIVWSVILFYILHLFRKYRKIKAELAFYRNGADQNSPEEQS